MTKRISKWSRSKNPAPLVLQARDIEIIKVTYSYRLITREQLQTIIGFSCTRRMNIRLRKLYDNRYLGRSPMPTISGSSKAIYFLGPKGTDIITKELGEDIGLVKKKTRKINQLKELFLQHTLELNDVRIAINREVKRDPEIASEIWINDNECEQSYPVIIQGKECEKKFRPDGYFRLLYQGKLHSFFLELDRSTMTLNRFKKKVDTYFEFARLGYYQRRFGVKYFRVLVVVPTKTRLNNLKKTVESVTDKVFWFTTLEEVTGGMALESIWNKAGSAGNHSLFKKNERMTKEVISEGKRSDFFCLPAGGRSYRLPGRHQCLQLRSGLLTGQTDRR